MVQTQPLGPCSRPPSVLLLSRAVAKQAAMPSAPMRAGAVSIRPTMLALALVCWVALLLVLLAPRLALTGLSVATSVSRRPRRALVAGLTPTGSSSHDLHVLPAFATSSASEEALTDVRLAAAEARQVTADARVVLAELREALRSLPNAHTSSSVLNSEFSIPEPMTTTPPVTTTTTATTTTTTTTPPFTKEPQNYYVFDLVALDEGGNASCSRGEMCYHGEAWVSEFLAERLPTRVQRWQDADFIWTFSAEFNFDYSRLHARQMVNHVDGVQNALANKRELFKTLRRYGDSIEPRCDIERFVPSSYDLATEASCAEFMEVLRTQSESGKDGDWLLKPENGSGGEGIILMHGADRLLSHLRNGSRTHEGALDTQSTAISVTAAVAAATAVAAQRTATAVPGAVLPSVMPDPSQPAPPPVPPPLPPCHEGVKTWHANLAQRYLGRPLLIRSLQNRKFNVRAYATVASTKPFVLLIDSVGYVSAAAVSFDAKWTDGANVTQHLTGMHTQQLHVSYSKDRRTYPWDDVAQMVYDEADAATRERMRGELKMLLRQRDARGWSAEVPRGGAAMASSWFREKVFAVVSFALRSGRVQYPLVGYNFNCVALDLLLDSHLNFWVLEVNSYPWMSYETEWGRRYMRSVVEELIDVQLEILRRQRANVSLAGLSRHLKSFVDVENEHERAVTDACPAAITIHPSSS